MEKDIYGIVLSIVTPFDNNEELDEAALQITPVHYLFKPDDTMMQRHFAQVVNQRR